MADLIRDTILIVLLVVEVVLIVKAFNYSRKPNRTHALKIKIFSGYPNKIGKEINEFIRDKDVMWGETKVSVSSSITSEGDVLIVMAIMLVYREKVIRELNEK
jgi:hypothetical protein